MIDYEKETQDSFPDDFKKCIKFHGHMCPGLAYGYIVAQEAISLLETMRAPDEEVVAICETDSCTVDAFQVLLGTTAGKGNLIIHDYGKSVFTIYSRKQSRAFRFSKKEQYSYHGEHLEEFTRLEELTAKGTATPEERKRQKILKAADLLRQPFENIFIVKETKVPTPAMARMAPSKRCDCCGELAMSTKMVKQPDGKILCIPCDRKTS